MTGIPFYNYNYNMQPQSNYGNYPIPAQTQAYNSACVSPYLPAYSPKPYCTWNSQMNAVMQAQVLPVISKKQGYIELTPFKVPILNSTGRLYQLDNGQAVAIIPKKGPTTIKTYVKTGSFNEEKNRGISHYIEHNLFNGSKELEPNQFVEKVTQMGGTYNASTDTADTDYFIKSPLSKPGDFDEFLKMHANMLMYPSFTEKMLEKEKGPVISEIQMYQDDPYDKAYNALIKNLFGIKADYQGLIAGSSKTIQNLTKNDVVNYYNEWYTPDNMLTVIVGNVDPDKTINTVSKLFNEKKASPEQLNKKHFYESLNLTHQTVREDIVSPRLNAGLVAIGLAGPKNNDIKDTFASMALLTALTGYQNARLTQALKPYSSMPGSDITILSSDFNAPQLLQLTANFEPNRIEDGLKTTYSVLQQMTYKPLNDKEMNMVKNKMKNNIATLSESSMSIADMVGKAVSGHGDIRTYTNAENYIDSLTPQDIQNAANKYLNLNRASIVVMHPQNSKQVSFGGNSNQLKFTNIKEYNLPNNLHVIINDDNEATKASANIVLRNDNIKTLKPGVSVILTKMLNKGTKNYSEEQLNQIIDEHNLDIAVSADEKDLSINSSTTPENLPLSLKIMKEILYNPDLSKEKFEKAKEEVKLTYSSVSKNPADRAIEVLYPDYPIGLTPRKTLEMIDNVTLNDVKELYQNLISNSQGTAVIDGSISKKQGLGNSLFMEMQTGIKFNQPYHITPDPESKSLEKNIVIAETEKNKNQADIVQVFKFKDSKNIKDEAALKLLTEILGGNSSSRLFSDLRETQKLAYRVNSGHASDGKYGILKLLIKTTTEDDITGPKHENLKKSLDGFKNHINKLITEPVSEKELQTAKEQIKREQSDNMEFSNSRAAILQSGVDTLYGTQCNNSFIDAIEQITPKDIQNAANLYLKQPSVISLIASPNTIKNTKSYLESLGEVMVY